jgi:two-component system, NarL family, sensor kinase
MKQLIILLFVLPLLGIAQTARVDSLKHLFANTTNPDKRMKIAFALCDQRQSMNMDSLFRYASYAKQVASQKNDLTNVALAESYLTNYLIKKGLIDSALLICNLYIEKLRYDDKNSKAYIRFSLLKGQVLIKMSKFKEALEQFFTLLAKAEANGDVLTEQSVLTNIGWIKMEMGQNTEALKWFYDSLKKGGGKSVLTESITYINMAAIYNNLKNKDSAEYYIKKAITLCRRNEDLQSLANALAVEASIFIDMKRVDKAEAPLSDAVNIRKLIGDPFYIVSDMMELGNYYAQNKQPEKGIKICREGIAIAEKNKLDSKLIILYQALAENYKVAGNSMKYEETLLKIISLKDSLYKKNSAEELAELQAKYDFQKQRNKIIQQNYELARENYLFYGSVILLCIVSIFSFFLFRQYRKRQKLRVRIIQEENMRKSDIAVTSARESERRRIAAELHDNLGSQLSYISSNMDFILSAPVKLSEADKLSRMQKINETAKSTIADLRETIWASRKEIIDFDELADKLKLYAQHQLAHKTNVQMEFRDNISERPALSSVEALNIYRIFQEAINNALKYAETGTIILTIITNSEFHYNITLADEGKGFDLSENFSGHYGLSNMRERARQISANILITSQKNKGTKVNLTKLK